MIRSAPGKSSVDPALSQSSGTKLSWLPWLLLTGAGWMLGNWSIKSVHPQAYRLLGLSSVGGGTFQEFVLYLIDGALLGLSIGLAQWLLLRRSFHLSSSWIASNVLGWAAAYEAYHGVQGKLYSLLPGDNDRIMIAEAAGFVVMGIVAGGCLSLLQRPILRYSLSNPKMQLLGTWVGWSAGALLHASFLVILFLPSFLQLNMSFLSRFEPWYSLIMNANLQVFHSGMGFVAGLISGLAFGKALQK